MAAIDPRRSRASCLGVTSCQRSHCPDCPPPPCPHRSAKVATDRTRAVVDALDRDLFEDTDAFFAAALEAFPSGYISADRRAPDRAFLSQGKMCASNREIHGRW